MSKTLQELHISVLLNELVDFIEIKNDKKNIIVDCTLGMGGHAREIIKKMNKGDIFIGFDADIRNLELVKPILENDFASTGVKLFFINDNFQNLKIRLKEIGIENITGIYYDLGISSLHIDDKERGFSFSLEGPLDMRFDTSKGISASEVINSYSKEDLIEIFREYGEEPASKKIAELILKKRKTGFRFKNTKDLSDTIGEISNFPKTKARIFQSLRIEVNKELEVIKESLKDAIELLDKGGKIFVISFHSLEDRIVKNILRDETKDCICNEIICICKHKKSLEILTKKPIIPTQEEIKRNSRSRSAKARGAKRI